MSRLYHPDDTIVAVASPPGGAYRGVVRLSGPGVVTLLREVFDSHEGTQIDQVRCASVIPGYLRLRQWDADPPCDLYLWPSTSSYTRQPTAELHTVGTPALLEAALETVCGAGARLAEPGEFTMRAFLAGRLDLTQAEAVMAVIDAGGTEQLDTALQQLAGGLTLPLSELRENLLNLLAHLEAGLDFVEEDIEFIGVAELESQLQRSADRIQETLLQMETRLQTVEGIRVVLVGAPNVGKSSLFNAIAGKTAAIVSGAPGTTRDYITCRVDIDGVACELVDTAGVEMSGPVRGTGAVAQQVTSQQRRQANLQIFCMDSTRPLNAWERRELSSQSPESRLLVLTKCDCSSVLRLAEDTIHTSSRTGLGLQELLLAIYRSAFLIDESLGNVVTTTAARCHQSLTTAGESLNRAILEVQGATGDELVATEVRVALDELGKVVGAVYTDDVLDRVFSRFCIGK